MTSRNYLIIWSIRFHVLLKAKRINLVFLKDWNNLEYDMKQQSANHSVYLGCAMSYAMSYAQHNFKHFNKKKTQKTNEIKPKKCWVKCTLNHVINLIKTVLITLNRTPFFFYDTVSLKSWNTLIITLSEH